MGMRAVETVGVVEVGMVETEYIHPLVMKVGEQLLP